MAWEYQNLDFLWESHQVFSWYKPGKLSKFRKIYKSVCNDIQPVFEYLNVIILQALLPIFSSDNNSNGLILCF